MDKPGEVVRVMLEGYDTDGKRISDVTVNWYGFTNLEANATQFAIFEEILKLVKQFSDVKNAVVEVEDNQIPRGVLR